MAKDLHLTDKAYSRTHERARLARISKAGGTPALLEALARSIRTVTLDDGGQV